jgi:endonuclease III
VPRESKASKQGRAVAVATALAEAYPESTCALRHETPFQLLVATMLSAQTTDIKVNEVTPRLFARFPDARAMAAANPDEVGSIINTIGLWRAKARNAIGAARMLVADFAGELPRTVAEMTRLPGVGRKTATAVLGTAFGIAAGITVDTHMLRINALLHLSTARDPEKMARELETLLPPGGWSSYTHRIIDHGRLVCVARRPRCGVCILAERGLCPSSYDPAAGYKADNDAREPASARGLSWRTVAAPT